MASVKKRRKAAKLGRERARPRTGPFRHNDGDRRQRGGPTIEQALADKQAMQQLGVTDPAE